MLLPSANDLTISLIRGVDKEEITGVYKPYREKDDYEDGPLTWRSVNITEYNYTL